jgi:pimeloyl-ACP methyl ester carboxylesterase
VLLVHAFGFDADMWEPQVEALIEQGYRALAPDLRGFGASVSPPPTFDFSTLVDDMAGVLDAAGAGHAVVAGVSMGAATAVGLAIGHPDLVDGLLLADNARPDGQERGAAAAERILNLGMEGLADVYEPILFGERFRAEHGDMVRRWRSKLVRRDPAELATIVGPYHDRPDPADHLTDVRVPTVVVFGEEDAAVPEHRRGDYLRIPDVVVRRIPEAGHISNLEAPEAFNEILFALLDRVASGVPMPAMGRTRDDGGRR